MRPALDRRSAVIGFATVLLANLIYCSGLPAILDPEMGMDPLYIALARRPLSDILRHDPSWGPLYGLWFKPLVALWPDPIAAYLANIYALSLAVPSLVYAYVLVLTRRAVPAVLAALFLLISDLNVPLAGKVSAFALLLVLCGLAVAELLPAGAPRLAAAAIATLLAAYARPELYLAAVGLCALAVAAALRAPRQRGRTALLGSLLSPALLAVCWAVLGSPLRGAAPGGERLLAAFREHFAWNWIAWNGRPAFYLQIWQGSFGDADSVWRAVLHNPGAVARHVADNLLGTAGFLARSAFAHYPLLAPATWPSLVRAEAAAVAAAVFAALLAAALRPGSRGELARRYRHCLLPWLVIAAPGLASAVLIYPLSRYLLIPAVLLIVAAALALSVQFPGPAVTSWRRRIVAALACLAAVPRPFVLPSAYKPAGPPFKGSIHVARPMVESLTFIRGLGLSPPVRVLTFTDGIGEMLGPGFNELKVWQKGEQPLEDYIRERRIDVIVTTEAGRGSFLVDDPYWTRLQAAPETTGFVALPVPNVETVRVYVRADRLPSTPPR